MRMTKVLEDEGARPRDDDGHGGEQDEEASPRPSGRNDCPHSPLIPEQRSRFLARRIDEAAASTSERTVFRAILRRAYDEFLELNALHAAATGVLADDLQTASRFREMLEDANRLRLCSWLDQPLRAPLQVLSSSVHPLRIAAFTPGPAPAPVPCLPSFFVALQGIAAISAAIDRVADGDGATWRRYIETLDGLWRRTEPLEQLHRAALRGVDSVGHDMLATALRIMARDLGLAGGDSSLGGEPLSEGLRSPAPRPPPVDGPIPWPPRPVGFPPTEPCAFIRDTCRRLVLGGSARLTLPLPSSTDASRITSISPRSACPGSTLTIHGSGFGQSQPSHLVVVLNTRVLEVVSWSDGAIEVRVPSGVSEGCLALRDERVEAQRRALHEQNQDAREEMGEGLNCLRRGARLPRTRYIPSPAPCVGVNVFSGGPPVIEVFHVNGRSELTITSGTPLTLTWRVRHATQVRIRRVVESGAPAGPDIDVTNPDDDTIELGPFVGESPSQVRYELRATNTCGAVTGVVNVRLRAEPSFRVVGIELVQWIQRFDLDGDGPRNDVRLVAHKRTLARVYVARDPSAPEGGSVTGSVEVAGQPGHLYLTQYFGDRVALRSLDEIQRDHWTHALNFELPIETLSGHVTVRARVWAPGSEREDEDPRWWRRDAAVAARFQVLRPETLVRVRVRDAYRGLPAPSAARFEETLAYARGVLPFAENGFNIVEQPGHEVLVTHNNLATQNGWFELLDEIEDFADETPFRGKIWAAVVADLPGTVGEDGRPLVGGIARPGYYYPNNPRPRVLAFQVGSSLAGAHELCHTFAVWHAPCGNYPGEEPDPRLPARTEDVAIDVAGGVLVVPPARELMCADGSGHSPSIALWNTLFDMLLP
jgi:hypothetical protein